MALEIERSFRVASDASRASVVHSTRISVGSLQSGALICRAYEAYLELHAPPIISFEHAWFLLFALARRGRCAARCNHARAPLRPVHDS
jgi:hypothetical protein